MRLKDIYREVVGRGISGDPRKEEDIKFLLEKRDQEYQQAGEREKKSFDKDRLINPFDDTRILCGDPEKEISSAIVGIDVDGAELLLADNLSRQGQKIDLVIAHHPQGKAYASFYEVMDVQSDMFYGKGVSISEAENVVRARKEQIRRKVSAANHQRAVDIARMLGLNFFCMHTPCDNLASEYISQTMIDNNPGTMKDILDILLDIPEYADAAVNNNPPFIFTGSPGAKVSNIHIEFTGGTEGPKDIYGSLARCGVDTIISMHQSEDNFNKCRRANINVIVASHIASDSLGVNLMLDYLCRKDSMEIKEFSGFRRVDRNK